MQGTIPLILQSRTTEGRVKEITEKLKEEVRAFFESGRYEQYLDVMSRFHRYSYRNMMLIAMQCPDATLVAGFHTWRENFGRHVKRGEKGIRILAPAPYKIKREREKTDPDTGKVMKAGDGTPIMEEVEVTLPAYKAVTVYDVSQTEGKELPQIAVELAGDVEQYQDFFTALERASPAPIGFQKILGGAYGYYDRVTKQIAVAEGMSQLQTIKTTIHEMAHARLHDKILDEMDGIVHDRQTKEIEAESVAYTVCRHFGLDTSDYSFGYIAGWSSGKNTRELESSLGRIREASSSLIKEIEEHFREICRERQAQQESDIGSAEAEAASIQFEELPPRREVEQPRERNKVTVVQTLQQTVPQTGNKKASVLEKLKANKETIQKEKEKSQTEVINKEQCLAQRGRKEK